MQDLHAVGAAHDDRRGDIRDGDVGAHVPDDSRDLGDVANQVGRSIAGHADSDALVGQDREGFDGRNGEAVAPTQGGASTVVACQRSSRRPRRGDVTRGVREARQRLIEQGRCKVPERVLDGELQDEVRSGGRIDRGYCQPYGIHRRVARAIHRNAYGRHSGYRHIDHAFGGVVRLGDLGDGGQRIDAGPQPMPAGDGWPVDRGRRLRPRRDGAERLERTDDRRVALLVNVEERDRHAAGRRATHVADGGGDAHPFARRRQQRVDEQVLFANHQIGQVARVACQGDRIRRAAGVARRIGGDGREQIEPGFEGDPGEPELSGEPQPRHCFVFDDNEAALRHPEQPVVAGKIRLDFEHGARRESAHPHPGVPAVERRCEIGECRAIRREDRQRSLDAGAAIGRQRRDAVRLHVVQRDVRCRPTRRQVGQARSIR